VFDLHRLGSKPCVFGLDLVGLLLGESLCECGCLCPGPFLLGGRCLLGTLLCKLLGSLGGGRLRRDQVGVEFRSTLVAKLLGLRLQVLLLLSHLR
jgi:hypothetical protein